ncbi:hypothetical protein COO60DRAFT_1635124 [Scenedesmus sp. NREL 46B-D3]|nr:hypothetical protein COO60DRAFT_1635124 [Scenedesmus sp. NREL 46B-D3]
MAGGFGRNPAGGVGGLLGALFKNKNGAQASASKSDSTSAAGWDGQFAGGSSPSSSSSSSSSYNPYGGLASWEQGALGGSGTSGSGPASGLPGVAAAAGGGASRAGTYNPYASVSYEQDMGQLAQLPGQAVGAMAGYGTGVAQQGHQTVQDAGSNMLQQGITSLQTPGQPVLGGNQQPTVVQGLGQDPNTYLLGGSDYYPGGSNAYGQAGGPGATYTAGQGALAGGALTPSSTIGGQYAGGQLDTGGGFTGQNPNPGGAFDPSTGQFAGSAPGQGQVPGGFYWTGGYWGYCPPPTPPAPMAMAPPPPPGTTAALITSPTPGFEVAAGPTGLAPVLLDASSSVPAPGRRIVAYGWVIKSATDGTPRATATGQTSTVLLPPGLYVVTLNVVDNTGASSTQGPLQFRVTGAGQASNAVGLGPNAVMAAVIASPPPIVIAGNELQGGNRSINLDASGSTPSPGHLIDRYIWTVTTAQPGNIQVLYNATLPIGSYIVSLVVVDTSGRNSSITQNFVVAGGTPGGLIAVISQPLSFVPASPGPFTTVLLDAQNSSPKPGSSITQYVWAIVDRANLTAEGRPTPIVNATGRLAQVRLRPGLYQVGLLVLDSDTNNAIAQKNFVVPLEDMPPPSPSPSPNPAESQPPVIPQIAAPLEGESGGRVNLPAISDPNNDPVDVQWDIKLDETVIKSGAGSVVSLQNVPPTVDEQLYTIVGQEGTGPAPPPPIPPPPAPTPLDIDLRLPSLTLSQDAVLEIDAGSTGVPFRNLSAFEYRWSLRSRGTGQTVTTQEGQHVSLPLVDAESLQLVLQVTEPPTNKSASGTSNIRVFPRPEQGTALPTVTGRCPPFRSNPSSDTLLGCPGITITGDDGPVPAANLTWAWRITRVDNQRIRTSLGAAPNFGRLPEANYIVEAAVGYNGPPTSTNTIYFLSSYLVVSPSNPPSQRPPGAAAPAASAAAAGLGPPGGGPAPAPAPGPAG